MLHFYLHSYILDYGQVEDQVASPYCPSESQPVLPRSGYIDVILAGSGASFVNYHIAKELLNQGLHFYYVLIPVATNNSYLFSWDSIFSGLVFFCLPFKPLNQVGCFNVNKYLNIYYKLKLSCICVLFHDFMTSTGIFIATVQEQKCIISSVLHCLWHLDFKYLNHKYLFITGHEVSLLHHDPSCMDIVEKARLEQILNVHQIRFRHYNQDPCQLLQKYNMYTSTHLVFNAYDIAINDMSNSQYVNHTITCLTQILIQFTSRNITNIHFILLTSLPVATNSGVGLYLHISAVYQNTLETILMFYHINHGIPLTVIRLPNLFGTFASFSNPVIDLIDKYSKGHLTQDYLDSHQFKTGQVYTYIKMLDLPLLK